VIAPRELPISGIVKAFAVTSPTTGFQLDAEWLNDLQTWLEGPYGSLVHDVRAPGLHASGLGRVCARRSVLIEAFCAVQEPKRAGNQLTFDIGHAMHFWWQHRYLGPTQELWGDWICIACPCPTCAKLDKLPEHGCSDCRNTRRKLTHGFMPMDCSCGVDWRDAIRFLEMPVVDEKLGYVGHADGLIVRPRKRVFEFKTSGPNDYPDLVAPKKDHIIQAHAYMRRLGCDEALVVYQDKGRQCDWTVNARGDWIPGALHIKPFIVRYDPLVWDPIERRIKDHHEAARLLQSILDEGRRPTSADVRKFDRVCSSMRAELARDCPVRNQCFML